MENTAKSRAANRYTKGAVGPWAENTIGDAPTRAAIGATAATTKKMIAPAPRWPGRRPARSGADDESCCAPLPSLAGDASMLDIYDSEVGVAGWLGGGEAGGQPLITCGTETPLSPSTPNSSPYPDFFTPPKGIMGWTRLW